MTTWPLATSFVVLLLLAATTGLFEGPMLPAMFAARQGTAPSPSRAESAPQPPASASAPPPSPKPSGLLVPTLGTHKALLIVGPDPASRRSPRPCAALSTKVSVHADAWVHGWAISRSTAAPVRIRGGYRIDVGSRVTRSLRAAVIRLRPGRRAGAARHLAQDLRPRHAEGPLAGAARST